MIVKLILVLLPWNLRRRLLQRWFGYEIDPSAWIGLAWIYPKKLRMGKKSRIGHFTVAVNLDSMDLGDHSRIGRSNWITGHPADSTKHFTHQIDRRPRLILGDHSAVTKDLHLDCTHEIRIGKFSTIAGYRSYIMTHSIDIVAGRQHSEPIEIGDYCFVSNHCLILGGARLPSQSVLSAGAVLVAAYDTPYALYGGVPARFIKEMPKDAGFFTRTTGFVI